MKKENFLTANLILFSLLFFLSSLIFSQESVSLKTEIENIEKSLLQQGLPAKERHANLVRLATLRQLSGDIEGAARNWLDAARALPGTVDDAALLNCAFCLAAMGQWDRARIAVEPLLAKSARARFLNTSINAITSNSTASLAALAENPEYTSMKREIYFLLWKLSIRINKENTEADKWQKRLADEFPQSPESIIANGGNLEDNQRITLRQSPFWLLIGGLDSLAILESEPRSVQSTTTTPIVTPSPDPTVSPAPASNVRLQTGIYSQYANAQAQAAKLREKGFVPAIEERQIGNTKMWAVTVPGGADINRTLAELKTADFDAFVIK